MNTTPTDHDVSHYKIRLRGHLEPRWAAWCDGWSLATHRDGTTTITGAVVDQAALHGLLQRIRDAGLLLVSITQTDVDQPGSSSPAPQQPPTTHPRRMS